MSKDRRHTPKQQTIFDCAFKIVSKNKKCYSKKEWQKTERKTNRFTSSETSEVWFPMVYHFVQ